MAHLSEPCGPIAHLLGRLMAFAAGWRIEGTLPQAPKMIILGAPHTSNWDFYLLLATVWTLRLRVHFLAKAELFRGLQGWLMRRLGGIPVQRRSPQGLVGELAERIARADRIAVLIPPEGTRSHAKTWKSGFYHLAMATGVPVVAGFADYARRRAGIKGSIQVTGDSARDMEKLRELYSGVVAKYPQRQAEIRLAAESEVSRPEKASSEAG